MGGKQICRELKEIRKKIADANDIPYVVSQCTYRGECRGTCPMCEAEIEFLEIELEKRKKMKKAIVVAGIAAATCGAVAAGCNYLKENSKIETQTMGAIKPTSTKGIVNE